jgi:hypothetical protein
MIELHKPTKEELKIKLFFLDEEIEKTKNYLSNLIETKKKISEKIKRDTEKNSQK